MSSFLQTCHLPGDKNVFNCSRDRNHRLCWQLLFLFFHIFFFFQLRQTQLSSGRALKVLRNFCTSRQAARSIPLSKYGPEEVEKGADATLAAVTLNGSRKQGLPHTSWVFLFLCHSSRMCLIWASVSSPSLSPSSLPLSLSPSRGSDSLGGGWVRLQLWGRF